MRCDKGNTDLDGPGCQTRRTGSGTVGRPKQMSEAERRGQLVAAAGEIFLQKGYRATTMDDIAQCAGMSKKTVYQIFPAKSELFDALLTEWLSRFPNHAGLRADLLQARLDQRQTAQP